MPGLSEEVRFSGSDVACGLLCFPREGMGAERWAGLPTRESYTRTAQVEHLASEDLDQVSKYCVFYFIAFCLRLLGIFG